MQLSVVAYAGYFTSRPTSKGWIRSSTSFLQAARQLEILASKGNAPLSATSTSSLGPLHITAITPGAQIFKQIRLAKTSSESSELASAMLALMCKALMQV